MRERAAASPNGHSDKQKGAQRTADNTVCKPKHLLDESLELWENKEAFTMFVETCLKPVHSTKWKAKQGTERLSDIVTLSNKAFVLLALENNWERWIAINDKAKNAHTASRKVNQR